MKKEAFFSGENASFFYGVRCGEERNILGVKRSGTETHVLPRLIGEKF